MTERTINAERVEQLIDVFGSFDENVRKIEDAFGIKITNRNNELKVTGDEEAADKGCRAIEALLALAAKGEEIDEQKVRYLIEQVRMYTATGQREYMDNYFEELNTTRRRENALEYFAEHYGDNDAFTLLKSAMTTSQNLSYTDRANPGESIFKDADKALYRVKQNGKHGCGFY